MSDLDEEVKALTRIKLTTRRKAGFNLQAENLTDSDPTKIVSEISQLTNEFMKLISRLRDEGPISIPPGPIGPQ